MQPNLLPQPNSSLNSIAFGNGVGLLSGADNPAYSAGVLIGRLLAQGTLTESQACESLGVSNLADSAVGDFAMAYRRLYGRKAS